jgi:hypothetical protein
MLNTLLISTIYPLPVSTLATVEFTTIFGELVPNRGSWPTSSRHDDDVELESGEGRDTDSNLLEFMRDK